MKADIITIGDELLIGQVINTNQAYIAGELNRIGVSVHRMVTVGDLMEDILSAFRSSWDATDVVIVTGGLGPTHDDITKKAVCAFFDSPLVSHDGLRKHLEKLFEARHFAWSTSAEEQTMFPVGATVLHNPVGTAAGIVFDRDGKILIVLPGVPYEMKAMIDGGVIPLLAPRVDGSAICHLTLRTTGISESALTEQLGDLEALLQGARLAFLPAPTGVRLRISVQETSQDVADRRAHAVADRIVAIIGKHVYGTGTEELEEVVGRMLLERRMTIAVAESCTGGLIAHRLTSVSGSSAYVDRAIVSYSNRSKTEELGVQGDLIDKHGAVSKEVALAMAEGMRRISGCSIAVSTTGIAGPTGGTAEKPVGLVWIGCADERGSLAVKHHFGGPRDVITERASQAALEIVRRRLLGMS